MNMKRINKMGMEYSLHEDKDKTIIYQGANYIVVDAPIHIISQCWYNWQMAGMFVQQAFYMLSDSEREFLMTGITPQKWNEMFAEKEEE